MKKRIIAIFIIIEILITISLNVIACAISNDADEIVFFKDRTFKNYLLQSYDKNKDGEISVNEMKNVYQIYLTNVRISDFTGIEYATNLKSLYMNDSYGGSNNMTVTLKGLIDLPNLTKLHLNYVEINDIENLYKLTNLTDLSLSSFKNKINMTGLSNLTNLINLSLWEHESNIVGIDDINAFSNFKKLENLELYCTMNNISGLSCLTNLKHLRVCGKNITDITSISNLTNLYYLDLRGNQISDISVLESMENLEEIHLWDNNISDISPLKNLINLKCLDLGSNKITDISILENLQDTCEIYADYQNISIDIGDIKQGTEMKYDLPLILSQIFTNKLIFRKYYKMEMNNNNNSYISDDKTNITLDTTTRGDKNINITVVDSSGSAILNLKMSYKVRADGDSINEIEFNDKNIKNILLHNYDIDSDNKITEYDMKNIEKIYLNGLNIQDLSGLEYATNLTFLDLGNNNLSDISLLSNLTNLTELYLNYNDIEDISPLNNLTCLKILYLSNNKISDISTLENLTNLKSLDIADNNISNIEVLEKLNLIDYYKVGGQQLELNLGNIARNSVKEIELPLIYKQYINYDSNLSIEVVDNGFVYTKESIITLNTKNIGDNCTNISISSRCGPLVNLKITYNVLPDKGDINGDGKINSKDWALLYSYINETKEFTYEQLLSADINNDGKVNNKDWNRLYNHINETDLLY